METSCARNTVESLAEEYSFRLRQGERPSLSDYARRSPQRADEIRELFPAVAALVAAAEPTGPSSVRPHIVPPPYAPGERLGDYRLLRELGRGGMGIVYEAIQEPLGRRVALKLMSQHGPLHRTQKERFRREAQSAARLHHTNIVPVFACGEHEGVPYYAMQYIEGRGLDTVLFDLGRSRNGFTAARRADDARIVVRSSDAEKSGSHDSGSLSNTGASYWQGIARIGLQVADALAYAHRAGVLHRDIKPANLLLDSTGRVWITDFGLAKASDQEDLTVGGNAPCTLRYMAPEGLSGKRDAKSDVFSLGLTLYELAALRPAYDELDRGQLLDALANKEPPELSRLRPDVPRDLETVIHKAMDRLPAARYQSAAEFADDLRRYLAGEPVRARKVSAAARAVRWSRRNPVVACLAATVTLLLMVGIIASSLASLKFRSLAQSRSRALDVAGAEATKAAEAAQSAKRAERRALERLYAAQVAEAAARQSSGQPGQRTDGLAAICNAMELHGRLGYAETERLQLRNLAIGCLSLPDLTAQRELGTLTHEETAFDFAPSLDRFAAYVSESDQHSVVLRRTSDRVELQRVPVLGSVSLVQLSPDGRFLAVRYKDQIDRLHVWDTQLGNWVIADALCGISSQAIDFRGDSKQLAVCTPAGGFALYNLPSGALDRANPVERAAFAVCYSPDGKRLAVACPGARRVEVFESASDLPEATLPLLDDWGFVDAMAFSGTGAFLAAASEKNICFWDARAAGNPLVLKGHHSRVTRLQFHPHLPLLFSSGSDEQIRVWEPMGRGLLLQTEGNLCRIEAAGKTAVVRSGAKLAQFAVDVPEFYRSFINEPSDKDCLNYMRDARMHPGGRLIATCGDWGLCFVDARDTARLAHVACGYTYRVWFGPTGRDLFYSGYEGLFRLPIQMRETAETIDLRFGPAERITLPVEGNHPHHFVMDAQGERLAVEVAYGTIVIMDVDGGGTPTVIHGDAHLAYIDLSPDGQWVVTGNQHGTRIEVFDARSGRSVKQIAGHIARGAFSPDGRSLVLSGYEGLRVLEIGTWREFERAAAQAGLTRGYPCFSPGSETVAVGVRGRQIMLLEPRTGRHLASFAAAKEASSVEASQYTCDGAFLLTRAGDSGVGVWDLARLRSSLADLGLDW